MVRNIRTFPGVGSPVKDIMARQTYPTVLDQNDLSQLEEQISEYRGLLDSLSSEQNERLHEALDITACYHEFAVEGVVLNHLEIKSALDERIISDSSLIPHYEEVRAFYQGIRKIRQDGSKKRLTLTVKTIKELHETITVAVDSKALTYRKEIPLHRQYAHDFAPPNKIGYMMKKLGDWLQSASFRKMPPLLKAAGVHNRIMAIFPWPRNSGSLARLVMNLVLIHADYPMVMVPAVERQTYYDNIQADLSHDSDVRMVNFLAETINQYIVSISKRLSPL